MIEEIKIKRIVCDVCKKEIKSLPIPQEYGSPVIALVRTACFGGDYTYREICQECSDAIRKTLDGLERK
jgi:hypothetical protein